MAALFIISDLRSISTSASTTQASGSPALALVDGELVAVAPPPFPRSSSEELEFGGYGYRNSWLASRG